MPQQYFVAWWNVENLFDSIRSTRRTNKLKRTLGIKLNGWTSKLRDKKITQLSKIISGLNNGLGPDLLGMCELENEFVVKKLLNILKKNLPDREYSFIHFDAHDSRGIDVAFIYDNRKLKVPAGQIFQHTVMRRTSTRDILQVNFLTKPADRVWSVFANHWPSRLGGEDKSNGYREIAGETLAFFHQRAMEVHGKRTPVLVMGDFNDEPFNSSLVRHALSTRESEKVINGRSPRLLNLMWSLLAEGRGTYFYKNSAYILDQILVNKNMIKKDSNIKIDLKSVRIEDDILGISKKRGNNVKPVRFGGIGHAVNENGFSDHYPISVIVNEKD